MHSGNSVRRGQHCSDQ